MLIKEFDFQIEKENSDYVLYFLNKNSEFKIEGYFTNIKNCLRRVLTWRLKDKKYPHKKDINLNKQLLEQIKELKQLEIRKKYLANVVYKPINDLAKVIYGLRKV